MNGHHRGKSAQDTYHSGGRGADKQQKKKMYESVVDHTDSGPLLMPTPHSVCGVSQWVTVPHSTLRPYLIPMPKYRSSIGDLAACIQDALLRAAGQECPDHGRKQRKCPQQEHRILATYQAIDLLRSIDAQVIDSCIAVIITRPVIRENTSLLQCIRKRSTTYVLQNFMRKNVVCANRLFRGNNLRLMCLFFGVVHLKLN